MSNTAPQPGAADPVPPSLEFFARIDVRVGQPVEVGETIDGVRRVIPILGGTVSGPGIGGTVLEAGADFQLIRTATLTELEAKYAIETEEGERIYIENLGVRSGDAADIARLVRGEAVDPARIYFMTAPRLRSASPRWRHLDERLFVARGRRFPDLVSLDVFMIG
ncbi:MAG: DUF3237 domain-containing protein [Candidatus Leucobacter sulfamidivorax]|nr:DUF3237 domain-containing protein [Candidatus Leucobacter sulfamidivorax]